MNMRANINYSFPRIRMDPTITLLQYYLICFNFYSKYIIILISILIIVKYKAQISMEIFELN